MFTKKTVRDVNLKGKTVLVRADYNVPLNKDGKIASDFRIQQSLPTIQHLLEQECRVVICSHLGRPEGPQDMEYSLRPVAQRLGRLLDKKVAFANDCVGESVVSKVKELSPGEVVLLENLRFHPEEEKNDDTFAKQLALLADVFVQDGFGVVHRAHASTDAITRHLPSVAGLLLEQEVKTITTVRDQPKRPLMAIVGGAKISDKIDILYKFVETADVVAVGGALANTFLLAQGVKIGKSLAEPDDVATARDVMERAKRKSKERPFTFYVPQDGVVASAIDPSAKTRVVDWGTQILSDIISYPKKPQKDLIEVGSKELILDIGPFSASFIAGALQLASTVVWNGNLGVTETKSLISPIGPTAQGTELVIDSLLGKYGSKPFSVIGGGDTAAYVEARKLTEYFGHVSTGGGASLELMVGKTLPGVAALADK